MFLAAMPKFMFSQTLEARNIGNIMGGAAPDLRRPPPLIRALRVSSQASRAAAESAAWRGRMHRP